MALLEAADPGFAALAAAERLKPGKCVLGHGQGGGRRDGPGDLHDERADKSARVPGAVPGGTGPAL